MLSGIRTAILSLPAVAADEETHLIESPFGRKTFRRLTGEALHPERESMETLARIRRDIGEYNFAGQYLQNPTPPGGNMVKQDWLKFYDPDYVPAKFDWIYMSWDTANKAGQLNDSSVCTVWGRIRKIYYLPDVFRRRKLHSRVGALVWRCWESHMLFQASSMKGNTPPPAKFGRILSDLRDANLIGHVDMSHSKECRL